MRKGIDFFPVDCHQSTAEQLLEAQFGCCGAGILIALYRKIYTEDGFYCHWDATISSLSAHHLHIEPSLLEAFINSALDLGIFHKESYTTHGILTSVSIQENYFFAVSRRKRLDICRAYLLLPDEELPRCLQTTPQNDCDSEKIADKNANPNHKEQHRIEEGSIREETIQKDSKAEETGPNPADCLPQEAHAASTPSAQYVEIFGLFQNIFLSPDDLQRLQQQFGEHNVKQYIERMSAYLHSSGKRYEDYAAKLANWMARDNVQHDPADVPSFDLSEMKLLKNCF